MHSLGPKAIRYDIKVHLQVVVSPPFVTVAKAEQGQV
jgi:hypothetical protein